MRIPSNACARRRLLRTSGCSRSWDTPNSSPGINLLYQLQPVVTKCLRYRTRDLLVVASSGVVIVARALSHAPPRGPRRRRCWRTSTGLPPAGTRVASSTHDHAYLPPLSSHYVLCRGCNLDFSARLLQLAVHDPVDYMSGRYMDPKPMQPKWLDQYKYPGQKIELRTADGSTVALPICSSPSEAQTASGVGNFSIINVVVEKHTAPHEVLNAKADDTFDISTIHGPGFSHPVNDDIKLPTFLEVSTFCVAQRLGRSPTPLDKFAEVLTSNMFTGEAADSSGCQRRSRSGSSQICDMLGLRPSHCH